MISHLNQRKCPENWLPRNAHNITRNFRNTEEKNPKPDIAFIMFRNGTSIICLPLTYSIDPQSNRAQKKRRHVTEILLNRRAFMRIYPRRDGINVKKKAYPLDGLRYNARIMSRRVANSRNLSSPVIVCRNRDCTTLI